MFQFFLPFIYPQIPFMSKVFSFIFYIGILPSTVEVTTYEGIYIYIGIIHL